MDDQKKVALSITISPGVVEMVEDYWHSNRLRSRSETIQKLIEAGLGVLCNEEMAA